MQDGTNFDYRLVGVYNEAMSVERRMFGDGKTIGATRGATRYISEASPIKRLFMVAKSNGCPGPQRYLREIAHTYQQTPTI